MKRLITWLYNRYVADGRRRFDELNHYEQELIVTQLMIELEDETMKSLAHKVIDQSSAEEINDTLEDARDLFNE